MAGQFVGPTGRGGRTPLHRWCPARRRGARTNPRLPGICVMADQHALVLRSVTANKCPFLAGMEEMDVPVAHGEGNFVARKEWILKGLAQAGQVVLRYKGPNGHPAGYPHNPNGSQDDVAGICDPTGRVLGLMPHPERHVLPTQHPQWTRIGLKPEGDGLKLFRNAVEFFKL